MGAEFLFMDDNARPHRANIVDECLQSEDITRMDCPACSPDLNPIEHVWDMLGRRIAACQPPPTCLPELRRALLDEWCNIGGLVKGTDPWLVCHEFEPSIAEDLPYRGNRFTLNLSRAKTSSRWCGVEIRREGCQLGVISSLEQGRQKPSSS
ncbi:transposable element Tcb2 transposase [Trichonephila clavipes]|nr:transposable element Tcb2 transposase [Trichonephila clavipes]